MKKAVWITLIVSLIVVNIAAELVGYYTRFEIIQLYRITLVLGFTVVAAIFSGAMLLISKLEEEKPLSGHVRDTLGADRAASRGNVIEKRSRPPVEASADADTENADKLSSNEASQ